MQPAKVEEDRLRHMHTLSERRTRAREEEEIKVRARKEVRLEPVA